MGNRPIEIDDLLRQKHYYLDEADKCYYFVEYTAGKGFEYSEGNQLVSNLKKSVDTKGTPQWKYKIRAINLVANLLASSFNSVALRDATFVPIPPSQAKQDPLYDPRMTQILERCANRLGIELDIRELLCVTTTMPASHLSPTRLKPDELKEYIRIDNKLLAPPPKRILLFDDVIAAGAHFRACKDLILEKFPSVSVVGIFVARRVPQFD